MNQGDKRIVTEEATLCAYEYAQNCRQFNNKTIICIVINLSTMCFV